MFKKPYFIIKGTSDKLDSLFSPFGRLPLKKKIKHKIWNKPYLYFPTLKLARVLHIMGLPIEKLLPRGAFRTDRIVNCRSELVIEGFERSGNTFAWLAFELAQGRRVTMAHHLHVPAQVVLAARLKVPTILLIREPLECVVSDLIRGGMVSKDALIARLADWVNFYQSVLPFKDQCVVADFCVTTREFGKIIERANRTFMTEFNIFAGTPENIESVFSMVNKAERDAIKMGESRLLDVELGVGRPSHVRRKIKDNFIEEVKDDPVVARAVQVASEIYNRFVDNPDVQAIK